MDPLTRAAQQFCRQLSEGWRRTPVVRLVAPAHHRSHLVGSLRIFEWAPDNRLPLCLVEAAADDLDALAEAARSQLLADLARLRLGLADDGIVLVEPAVIEVDSDQGLDPLSRLRSLVARAGGVLARTGVLAGLALVLVPADPPVPKVLRRLAVALAAWPVCPEVRLGLAVHEPSELAGVLPAAVAFELDDAALHDYCQVQGERQAAASPPAEVALRRHLLAATDAARRQDLSGARRAYLAACTELESQHRFAEAAVVHITLGGLAFGLKDDGAALSHFERAARHGTTVAQPAITAQAHLGAAGVLFSRVDLEGAARRYELAAGSAPSGALRIEALRMAGTCRLQLGDRVAAAAAWQAAVTDAGALPAAARVQTTWKQAGEALLAHLQRGGQHAQAAHLRALLQAD